MGRLFMVFFIAALQAQAAPPALTYQGRILTSSGTPLNAPNVSFQFEILNPSGSCMLYREQVSGINMTNSNGMFDIKIGASHTYPASGSFTVSDTFNNSSSFVCEGGVAYNPTLVEGRLLRVQFYDGSTWRAITPDSVIRSVPFAAYAEAASKIGIHEATDFILKTQVNGNTTCDSGSYLTWNATTQTFGCAAGGSGTGSVTGVTSTNSYLTVANGTTAPAITVNVGTVANTVAAGNDSRFTDARTPTGTAGGDLSSNYPNPVVSKILGRTLDTTAPSADGQVMAWDTGSSSWKVQYVRAQDLRTAWGGTQMIPSTACAANEAMVWSVITDRFACQSIGSLNASAISAGVLNVARLGTGTPNGTKFLRDDGTWQAVTATESDPKVGTITTDYMPKWNGTALVTGAIAQDSSNNVGIGTAAPAGLLQVHKNTNADVDVLFSNPNAGTSAAMNLVFENNLGRLGALAVASSTHTQTAYKNTMMLESSALATGLTLMTAPGGGDMRFNSNGDNTRMIVKQSGNIGIGTDNPEARLSLGGGVGAKLLMYSDGASNQGFGIDMTGQSYEFNMFGVKQSGNAHLSFGFITGNNTATYDEVSRMYETGETVTRVTDPDKGLELRGSFNHGDSVNINFFRSRGTAAAPTSLQNGDEIWNILSKAQGPTGDYFASAIMSRVDGTPAGNVVPSNLSFWTRNSAGFGERVTITPDGNLGIGLDNAWDPLIVLKNYTGFTRTEIYNSNSAGGSALSLATDQGSSAAFISMNGSTRNDFGGFSTMAIANKFGDISFRTDGGGGDNERMRIAGSTGLVTIGTTSSSGAVARFTNSAGSCTMLPASSGVGITCSSDERLKRNIASIPGDFALEKIIRLRAVDYEFKGDVTGARHTGYIAQEMQKVAPEFVRKDDVDGFLQVSYTGLIPWITESIKQLHGLWSSDSARLHQELATVQTQLSEQKQLNQALEKRLQDLEEKIRQQK